MVFEKKVKILNQSAFTLVEILTGIVLIAVISACSWVAVSTLFRSEQLSRDRTIAINLLQKSQEELRKASLTFFDAPQGPLEKCQFPGPAFNGTNKECGLQALNVYFNNYTRSVEITPEGGSTEIKRAVITVNWTDQGNTKKMYSQVLLSRPPTSFPGNIIGTVRSSAAGNPLIKDVSIKVKLISAGTERSTTSKSILGAKNENFDFFETSSGAFVLPVGSYRLTVAESTLYYAYTHPTDITVTSNYETPVDFILDPKPASATIRVKLINEKNGQLLPNFFNGTYYILDDYAETNKVIAQSGSTSGSHTINFTDSNPRSFTINTYWAYRSGYSGQPTCNGHSYQFDGWSSAQLLDDKITQTCTYPYNGSRATDRITVNPGDDITVLVPLYPVPTATITGKVVDQNGSSLAGATVYAMWPKVRGSDDWWYRNGAYQSATTDSQGEYTFVVPAVQELFPNNASGALRVQARRNMPYTGCCDSTQWTERYSNWVTANNLFNGSTIAVADMIITSGGTTNCGNVQGQMKDDLTGSPLNGVNISIRSTGTTTAGSGDYIYQCPGAGYRLPEGAAKFSANKNSTHYPYDSGGNTYYSAGPNVNIPLNNITTYNAKLWPFGYGKIIVKVKEKTTNIPIVNAQVKVVTHNNWQTFILSTDATGTATFSNVLETWPPKDLPNDPYYANRSINLLHTITVTDPSAFYPQQSRKSQVLQREGEITETFELVPGGGV